jgi:diadenosine tetraphosphate (Ap4A) HIT family hydrolase
MEGCLACELSQGIRQAPGGAILTAGGWRVEHCVGPLGVGTLIVKPLRHCLSLADLTPAEAAALGPLLARVAGVVRELAGADQVYCCLWSHAGWEPGHIHFVVQPVRGAQAAEHPRPGPALQVALFDAQRFPDPVEAAAFAERAREHLT